MSGSTSNPLVSTKPSETPLSVAIHPLVLLTASDLITRHNVRQMDGPIVGILLGQQKGQEITAEHAFPGRLFKKDDGRLLLHESWTETRIQQFKDVHKAPALDVVGWFTTTSEFGPTQEHLHIQRQLTTTFSENGFFLAIHPAAFGAVETTNRKLPLTIFESIIDAEHGQDDTTMQIDGEDIPNVKFRELPYTIETDETEMIAIDYVAKGAGSAAAVEVKAQPSSSKSPPASADDKGKQRLDGKLDKESDSMGNLTVLTPNEEDHIAGITTRLNSVKMLQSRLQAIQQFATALPSSYLSDNSTPFSPNCPTPEQLLHLRNIQALVTRLSLLTPAPTKEQATSRAQEAARTQRNDVALTNLLAQLGQNVQGLAELGRKFAAVEQGKNSRGKGKGGFNQGAHGGADDHDGRMSTFALNGSMLV